MNFSYYEKITQEKIPRVSVAQIKLWSVLHRITQNIKTSWDVDHDIIMNKGPMLDIYLHLFLQFCSSQIQRVRSPFKNYLGIFLQADLVNSFSLNNSDVTADVLAYFGALVFPF